MNPEDAYITTFTGKQFHFLDPQPDQICIEDIAHQLSGEPRFNHSTTAFYSVAEHSVFVALCAPVQHRVAALLHDAAEAYFKDIARPLKYLPQMAGYRELIAKTEAVIAAKFGFTYPLDPIIKELDGRIILDEKDQFLPHAEWSDEEMEACEVGLKPLGVTLRGWLPRNAEAAFLETYFTLGEPVVRQ
jgi:hypothetical protein